MFWKRASLQRAVENVQVHWQVSVKGVFQARPSDTDIVHNVLLFDYWNRRFELRQVHCIGACPAHKQRAVLRRGRDDQIRQIFSSGGDVVPNESDLLVKKFANLVANSREGAPGSFDRQVSSVQTEWRMSSAYRSRLSWPRRKTSYAIKMRRWT